jgi:serine/threonine protein kinase
MRGIVPEFEAERLEKHLVTCSSCLNRLRDLPVEDPLVEFIQGSASTVLSVADESRVDSLICRLKALQSSLPGQFSSQTTGAGDDFTVGPDSKSFPFLASPHGPGEIGRLGSYRILRVLGTGGMGIVFEAQDVQLERHVALKVMKPHLTSKPRARERFLREAKAAAAIAHDHIVPIFQVGEDRGVPFLAMALLNGESLEDRLKRERKLPISELCRIGREVAEGLAVAHEQGLIHRDIKPANIWLESASPNSRLGEAGGRVKILDFGLAQVGSENVQLTQTGTILGSPGYMAPEQIDGRPAEPRSDLFSLGCIIYRMATGQLPFQGHDVMSVLWAVATKDPQPPRELNATLPPAISDLVMQLLAKRPEDRPPDSLAVVQRLRAIEDQGAGPLPAPRSIPVTNARPRSRRWGLVAAVALAAMIPFTYFFGAPLIRFITNKGELVVEVDDPKTEVEIAVRQNEIVVRDRTSERAFVLRAGEGEVEVYEKASGLKIATRRFTLTRGAKEIVAVHLERATDRRAAEWALRLGGTIQVSQAGSSQEITSITNLPQGDFELRAINLKNKTGVVSSALACLEKLPNLRELNLDGTGVDDSGLEHLRGLTTLEKLSIGRTRITDAGLVHLKDLPHLRVLNLEATRVGDIGLASLRGNSSLENLSLGATRVSDHGLTVLASLPSLRSVFLGFTAVGDEGLSHLKHCGGLNDLGLAVTHITDAGLVHLKEMGGLEQLNLTQTMITDDAVPMLQNLRNLRRLYLSGTKLTTAGVASLQKALPQCTIRAKWLSK